ncbi:TPA: bifunctional enoyl-CoA hydratase/phosphate acetyltransferase [Legionella pneumophila]|uniref:Bifunctional enoyl-CoA hydratase/phosphate acetyltransferase n=4 Tax=Legionella TaxID=445 RepID=A0A0W0XQ64_9GAMM|nr:MULTISPECIES: bifunctional enoyl-CoA hydratase/phosphate acetyltransferase [Legionella]AMQ28955.1 bifunctional enoyl-CoA hydratase/phosphate acetyltransferase [Legionella pneumophila subsp. pneumophila]AMV15603.1 Phosphate acetyltransferase [Legionella pneumophila]ETO94060.1 phosphate butyryltransferase [Legionella oakridgensis RV-2-2007]KTD07333.1 bifunctional enoyl-CoA hydratase/phosphate acetyltransferase [Legionella jamestowniensis]KTD46865.1 bifunctional enoyl-CoA hydratase/phosphate a
MDKEFLENVTFDELTVGRQASLSKTLTQDDINLFAAMSGDVNPAHMDPVFAQSDIFHGIVGHGMWSGSLISTLLGTIIPGPGTIYLKQDIQFKKPVRLGDTLTITIIVKDKGANKPRVIFNCKGVNQHGETVIEGLATVLAPTKKVRVARTHLPSIEIHNHDRFEAIIKACRCMGAVRTAIVHPVSMSVMEAVNDAVNAGLIIPILIGPLVKMKTAALEASIDLSQWETIDTEHSDAAASKAAELAASGEIDAIMKGSLSTHELMGAIVPTASGLRTQHRVSHAYVMDIPSYHKPLIITDAAINIAPTATDKADICQNAINLWRVLFGEDKKPKVAILAAIETVNPKMQATVDASILCKMADRGQINDGILDGPLAFDNAINKEAAKEKGIISSVAGDPDILLVPEIESGNILAKQLTFLGHADAAGIVLGARVPFILVSRADSLRTRLFSCSLAVKLAAARKEGRIK